MESITTAKPHEMEKRRIAILRRTRVNSLTRHRKGVLASSEGQAAMSLFERLPDE